MRRLGRAILGGYVAGVTVLAGWWGVRAALARRLMADLARRGGPPGREVGFGATFRDFGVDRTRADDLGILLADLGWPVVLGLLALAALLGAGVAAGGPRAGAEGPDRVGMAALRWARRGSVAAWGALVALVGWNLALIRLGAMHPSPWPLVALLGLLGASVAVAAAAGVVALARGPRRGAALAWAGVALGPPALCGAVGLYALGNWKRRVVPDDLATRLAKIGGAALIRLEASVEYPDRVATGRLVMFHDRVATPDRDAAAMDAHLARLEGLLGGPLRTPIYWVRGRVRRLGLGGLSVHGLALGSDSSPADWATEGALDRHELAHAAIDQFRPVDADPPFLLHEGWAEAQSVLDPAELAQRALAARRESPALTVRALVGPGWYHRDSGPVYPIGGAFVAYLIRTHGMEAYRRFDAAIRPDRVDATCRAAFGRDLDPLEAAFWADAEALAGHADRGVER